MTNFFLLSILLFPVGALGYFAFWTFGRCFRSPTHLNHLLNEAHRFTELARAILPLVERSGSGQFAKEFEAQLTFFTLVMSPIRENLTHHDNSSLRLAKNLVRVCNAKLLLLYRSQIRPD